MREAIYESMSLPRRRPWHRRVADALIAARESDPDAIAYHLERADDARLVEWLIQAGEQAQQRFAWAMAADRFDRAQLLMENDPERMQERAWLLFRIGLLVRNTDHRKSLASLDAAEQIASTLDMLMLLHLARAHHGLVLSNSVDVDHGLREMEVSILALETLDEEQNAFLHESETALAMILGIQGRGTVALKLAESGRLREARVLLESWNTLALDTPADAHRATGVIEAYQGKPDRARQAFRRSRAMYEARHDRSQAGDDLYGEFLNVQIPYGIDQVHARRELVRAAQMCWTDPRDPLATAWLSQSIEGVECVISGKWQQAFTWLDHYWDHSPNLMSPFHIWRLYLARDVGDLERIQDAIRWTLPDGPATEPGAFQYFVFAALQQLAAELALGAGNFPLARLWLDAHDRVLEWSGAVLGQAENRLLWVRYHWLTGDTERAIRYAESALILAGEPRQPLALVAAHRLLGGLNVDSARYDAAGEHLTVSLALADACAAPFERAESTLSPPSRR